MIDELARRVSEALRPSWPSVAVRDLTELVGGASSLTYAVRLDRGPAPRVVVKVAPPGLPPVRNRDVLRQARVLKLLGRSGRVPVPEVYARAEASGLERPPLFVMGWVDGVSDEPLFLPSPASPDEVRARALRATELLSALHREDAAETDEEPADLGDELARWTRACDAALPPSAVESELRERLQASIPVPLGAAMCHGDWRLGNMLAMGDDILAVIDWEIWSVADPRLDLAWFLMMCDSTHPAATQGPDTGMPKPGELLERYANARGCDVPELGWFRALAAYKQVATTALIARNAAKRGAEMEQVTGRMNGMLPELLNWAGSMLDAA